MYENIIKNTHIYARKRHNEKGFYEFQTLNQHLNNVSYFASLFAKDINAQNLSKLIAILHDIGKASLNFQNYLIQDVGKRGDVIHALQGAIFSFFQDKKYGLLKEILSIIIYGHHNNLFDCCSLDGREVFFERVANRTLEDLSYEEVINNLDIDQIQNLLSQANDDLLNIINSISQIYKSKESAFFALGLLVKYFYSCLIDADRLDAYLFEIGEEYKEDDVDWSKLIDIFETNLAKLQSNSPISRIRQEISQKCLQAANKATGIYQLSVPTGGGKTYSSLRFALHHCKKYNKKRIIYVIPYLSIIEQTSKNIRSILDLKEQNDIILEHHSNIVLYDDDEKSELKKLSASRWDKPIIITTMVQFLESVMSSRAGKLRKLHNMANTVIIFDEIQSLPIKTIHIFNEIISFLSNICNSTILLCTATQPLLSGAPRNNLLLQEDCNLIGNTEEAFKKLNRTQLKICNEKDIDELSNFALEQAKQKGNCLVIMNTKKYARDLYNKIKEFNNEFKVFHLSTAMCSVHRFEVLNDIINSLNNKEKIICITTQLIEAGVDISFNCVIRSLAGLDSIAQAAGRCNRHGESPNPQDVYVVPLKNENLQNLKDIEIGKEVSARVIRENPDANLLSQDTIDKYYQYYFFNRKGEMDYVTKDGYIYNMASLNITGRGNYANARGKDYPFMLSQAFYTADTLFSVIDNKTESVVVYYKDSSSLINKLINRPKGLINKEILLTLRELSKYSVSLFPHEIKALTDQGSIYLIDEELGIKVLAVNFYSQETGVVINNQMKNYIL